MRLVEHGVGGENPVPCGSRGAFHIRVRALSLIPFLSVSACPRIVIKNGKATRASGHYSKYYATCDEGYRLNGPNVLICDQYDKWSTIPTCDLSKLEPLHFLSDLFFFFFNF